jgi:DNA-binding transcriptional ArsR family regulator
MTFRYHFSPEDLGEIRFAFSPVWELVSSLRCLESPSKHALHLRWILDTQERTKHLDVDRLGKLFGGESYVPDFLTPPPDVPFPEFEEELERIVKTDHDQVRKDIVCWQEYMPDDAASIAEAFLADPDRSLRDITEEMRAYWNSAVASHWPRIRTLLEGDVLYRARRLALEGVDGLFADLHQRLRWQDDVLVYDKPSDLDIQLGGRGLLLIPSVFVWPKILCQIEAPWQPTICYAPRGVGNLWEPQAPGAHGGIDELIGDTRAEILRTLEIPMTTGELASKLGVTAAAVSQQLAVLRRTGVVDADRVGRSVYSRRTQLGESLLGLLS